MNCEDLISPTIDATVMQNNDLFDLIRQWRNAQLSASDWTQLPDSTVDKAAWAAYRQELRDLPAQNDDPKLIVFPEPPK